MSIEERNTQPAVRFSSNNEEISPQNSLRPIETITGHRDDGSRELNPQAEEEIRQLKTTLQGTVQSRRMEQYAFEPVSLPGSQPVSRVPSGTMTPSRRLPAGSAAPSPRPSPPQSTVHSPPLTPAVTAREAKQSTGAPSAALAQKLRAQANVVTPQRSTSPDARTARSRPGSVADASGVASQPRPTPRFSIGPGAESAPPSEEVSPVTTPGATTPGGTILSTKQYPPGDPNDPYARSKRPPPKTEAEAIEARFRFGNRDPRHGFSNSSSNVTLATKGNMSASNLAGSLASTGGMGSGSSTPPGSIRTEEKASNRHSFFGGSKNHHDGVKEAEKDKGGSSSNLKRFFKFGGHNKSKEKKAHSPSREGTHTPPNGSVPFADDHGLQSRYGKFGKMLGSGAGGSVRLMKRTGDGKTFAVKQFRTRHAYESEREYNKKVTAEFCIGSTLHHGNIIETIDIVHEKGAWFEVMEYAPFDLFATVMTGKMSKDEVTCCTLQILSGVTYLHSMGLAHRDLKLDNVVINEHGIMKIIDFGSAVVFRYPFENDVVLATGVVGSDPYLAPEVYDNSRYDPQPADVWSIAIIFCCMCLRRFPWKAPRISDNSYRLFVSPPDPGQESLLNPSKPSSQTNSRNPSVSEDGKSSASAEDGHHHHRQASARAETTVAKTDPQATIKGPIRLLRLLPRDTRHIIGRMLELDPKKRATIDEILDDPWVANALVCRQEEEGKCFHAPNHTHALEGGGVSSTTKK